MAGIAGYNGKIFIGTQKAKYDVILYAKDMTITVNRDEIDVSSYNSDGWKENISGMASWEVSAECVYNMGSDHGQIACWNAIQSGEAVRWKFLPNRHAPTGTLSGWEGKGIVTSFEVGVPLDDAVTVSLTVIGTKALVRHTMQAVSST
jgi:TP901-1 family phage major tail protein